jgi:FKBP-type peptidyl-prolyl cis-trans isomerase
MQKQKRKGNGSLIVSIIIVVCVIGGIMYLSMKSVSNDETKQSNTDVKTTTNTDINGIIETTKTISNEQQENTQNTMEKVAKNGDILVMNYTGRFTNGKVFDSNILPEFNHVTPFEFTLGAGQVIAGWDEGLVGMKVGEKKTLTVPPEKGYGPNDYHGIPGNSTLIFDVELVNIK